MSRFTRRQFIDSDAFAGAETVSDWDTFVPASTTLVEGMINPQNLTDETRKTTKDTLAENIPRGITETWVVNGKSWSDYLHHIANTVQTLDQFRAFLTKTLKIQADAFQSLIEHSMFWKEYKRANSEARYKLLSKWFFDQHSINDVFKPGLIKEDKYQNYPPIDLFSCLSEDYFLNFVKMPKAAYEAFSEQLYLQGGLVSVPLSQILDGIVLPSFPAIPENILDGYNTNKLCEILKLNCLENDKIVIKGRLPLLLKRAGHPDIDLNGVVDIAMTLMRDPNDQSKWHVKIEEPKFSGSETFLALIHSPYPQENFGLQRQLFAEATVDSKPLLEKFPDALANFDRYVRNTLKDENDLSDLNLANIDFRNFDFSNRNLAGANLTGANLAGANRKGIIIDENTKGRISCWKLSAEKYKPEKATDDLQDYLDELVRLSFDLKIHHEQSLKAHFKEVHDLERIAYYQYHKREIKRILASLTDLTQKRKRVDVLLDLAELLSLPKDLSHLDLTGANLEGLSFDDVNIEGTQFANASYGFSDVKDIASLDAALTLAAQCGVDTYQINLNDITTDGIDSLIEGITLNDEDKRKLLEKYSGLINLSDEQKKSKYKKLLIDMYRNPLVLKCVKKELLAEPPVDTARVPSDEQTVVMSEFGFDSSSGDLRANAATSSGYSDQASVSSKVKPLSKSPTPKEIIAHHLNRIVELKKEYLERKKI